MVLSKREYNQHYYAKHREEVLAQKKEYYLLNKVEENARGKKYQKENRESIRIQRKEYRERNKKSISQVGKEYYLLNSSRIKEYQKTHTPKVETEMRRRAHRKIRFQTDIQYRLKCLLRTRLNSALLGYVKKGSAVRDLGCTIPELKMYLEGQFRDGMTWENRGFSGWHIDHKIPLTFFDLSDRKQFLEAVHYTNLQPLWRAENISKGSRISDSSLKGVVTCAGRKVKNITV